MIAPHAFEKKNKNKPKDGWIVELEEAEREVKTANQKTSEHYLCVARAARKLRIWNKSKTAAEKFLLIDDRGPLRAQLTECQKQAGAELSIPTEVDSDAHAGNYRTTLKGDKKEVDLYPAANFAFNNLNKVEQVAMRRCEW
jgi:hypothetical protein